MTKKITLCSCGDCRTATARAVKLMSKMMDDDECATFVIAVGSALASLGAMSIQDQHAQEMVAKGMPELLADIGSHQYTHELADRVSQRMVDFITDHADTEIIPALNEAIQRRLDRKKEEENLPKGD